MNKLFKNKYRIDTTRLKNWDYSSNGVYYITICTKDAEHYLGSISEEKMQLTGIGEIAFQYWKDIPLHYPMAILDEFVIMPNHIHGIIIIDYGNNVETNISFVKTQNFASLHDDKPNQDFASLRKNEQKINFASLYNHKSSKKWQTNKFGPQSKNIPAIIRGYKAAVKKHATLNNISFIWHPRFHDRVVFSEKELQNVKEYIRNNPSNWETDIENK